MKSEDFERLKAVCEKEGFDVYTYKEDTNLGMLIHIKPKKDKWEGIEFFQFKGNHFKVEEFYPRLIRSFDGLNYEKKHCEPSTESAYVAQLKAEAFKRLGEIKEGDSFDREDWKMEDERPYGIGVIGQYIQDGFNYRKCNDSLMFRGTTIYRQGKWASRVPKRIDVKAFYHNDYNLMHRIDFKTSSRVEITKKELDFLASALEKFLNNE